MGTLADDDPRRSSLATAETTLRLAQRVIHEPTATPLARQEARDAAAAAHTRIQQLRDSGNK
jgi:hypothetical protein